MILLLQTADRTRYKNLFPSSEDKLGESYPLIPFIAISYSVRYIAPRYKKQEKMGNLELLCEEFGHKLLLLPPYSPEYNPIEKTWAHIKKHLKKVLPSCNTFFETLLSYSCFNLL